MVSSKWMSVVAPDRLDGEPAYWPSPLNSPLLDAGFGVIFRHSCFVAIICGTIWNWFFLALFSYLAKFFFLDCCLHCINLVLFSCFLVTNPYSEHLCEWLCPPGCHGIIPCTSKEILLPFPQAYVKFAIGLVFIFNSHHGARIWCKNAILVFRNACILIFLWNNVLINMKLVIYNFHFYFSIVQNK